VPFLTLQHVQLFLQIQNQQFLQNNLQSITPQQELDFLQQQQLYLHQISQN